MEGNLFNNNNTRKKPANLKEIKGLTFNSLSNPKHQATATTTTTTTTTHLRPGPGSERDFIVHLVQRHVKDSSSGIRDDFVAERGVIASVDNHVTRCHLARRVVGATGSVSCAIGISDADLDLLGFVGVGARSEVAKDENVVARLGHLKVQFDGALRG